MPSSPEVPQGKPHAKDVGGAGSNDQSTTAARAPTAVGGVENAPGGNTVGPMQHDLEVAQACLNLRQESKTAAPSDPKEADNGGGSGGGGYNGGPDGQFGPGGSNNASPSRGPGMASLPPINQGEGGGRPGGMMHHMPPGGYMGVPNHIEFGPNGMPMKEMHPYYNNMTDNSGHFYPHFPSEEQYHAMMRGMSYYGMMSGENDGSNGMMANPNAPHFFPGMMPGHEGGHFNGMMAPYPQGGGGYMKRPHPSDFSTQGGSKKSKNGSSQNTPEGSTASEGKKLEKTKKGKRAADMPRRPLSAYNFFFSEERERILAAIPDPVEKKSNTDDKADAGSSTEKENAEKEGGNDNVQKEEEKDQSEDLTKFSKEEMHEKMAARSKRLLALREQQTNKRRPHRKTHGKIGFKELVKKIGERWRALPNDQREYYAGLAETDLKRYKEQMTDYNNKLTHQRITPNAY